jgi:hypothetical protein
MEFDTFDHCIRSAPDLTMYLSLTIQLDRHCVLVPTTTSITKSSSLARGKYHIYTTWAVLIPLSAAVKPLSL